MFTPSELLFLWLGWTLCRRILRSILFYLLRYGPSEIGGTAAALGAAHLAHAVEAAGLFAIIKFLTVGFVGSIGEAIGFFAVRIAQEHVVQLVRNRRQNHRADSLSETIGSIVREHGWAEITDTFGIRPLSMLILILLIPVFELAVFIGKLVADIWFYGYSIYTHRKMTRQELVAADA
ncbi:MAG: hypothetical protein JWN01_1193 [Patescibacteria group bacterium]|nr:hypothetical protein [Patescibacteria group bacterium]